jgi:hypothetical protein
MPRTFFTARLRSRRRVRKECAFPPTGRNLTNALRPRRLRGSHPIPQISYRANKRIQPTEVSLPSPQFRFSYLHHFGVSPLSSFDVQRWTFDVSTSLSGLFSRPPSHNSYLQSPIAQNQFNQHNQLNKSAAPRSLLFPSSVLPSFYSSGLTRSPLQAPCHGISHSMFDVRRSMFDVQLLLLFATYPHNWFQSSPDRHRW